MNLKKGLKALLCTSSVMMALTAAAPMAVNLPVLAVEGEEQSEATTLTIKNMPQGTSYKVYKIFSGDYSGENLTNPQFASEAVKNAFTGAVMQVLNQYPTDLVPGEDASVSAAKWAKFIADYTWSSEETISFANQLAINFSVDSIQPVISISNNADETADSSSVSLDTGYYVLIPEDRYEDITEHDTTNAILIQIKDGSNVVYSKDSAGMPKVDKTSTTTGWEGEGKDAVFNLNYTIKATLSNNIYDYIDKEGDGRVYKYVITDKLPIGLDASQQEIEKDGTWNAQVRFAPKAENSTDKVYDLSPAVGVAEITEEDGSKRTQITWSFTNLIEDLQNLRDEGLQEDQWLNYQIVATYTPVFDDSDKANLFSQLKDSFDPMVNYVKVSFTNDPFAKGDGTIKDTPWDEDEVETYTIQVTKKDDNGNKLIGADFEIYGSNGEVIKANKLDADSDKSTFQFTGLVAGVVYRLSETSVPAGYTAEADVFLKITEEKDSNGDTVKDGNGNPMVKLERTDENGEVLIDGAFPTYIVLADSVFKNGHYLASPGVEATVINKSNIGGLPITGQQGMALGLGAGSIIIAISAASILRRKKEEVTE